MWRAQSTRNQGTERLRKEVTVRKSSLSEEEGNLRGVVWRRSSVQTAMGAHEFTLSLLKRVIPFEGWE